MRRIISSLLIVMAFASNARQVSPGEAQTIAADFFNSSATSKANKAHGRQAIRAILATDNIADPQPYYIFNAADRAGFVIVSGDTRVNKILGYSDNGSFDTENMPPQLEWLLAEYRKQLDSMPEVTEDDQSWENTGEGTMPDGVVLKTANWGQFYPYNLYCPKENGIVVPSGCANTAQAILMKYYNWPSVGTGVVTHGFNGDTISIDLSKSRYDWNLMKDDYPLGQELSPDEENAIATLLRDISYANQTDFSLAGSGACVRPNVFYENFNYAPKYTKAYRSTLTQAEIVRYVHNEIDNGRVLLVESAHTPISYGAHEYICDGYSGNDYLHFNFGWDGNNNGFYYIGFTDDSAGMDISFMGGIEPYSDSVKESDCLQLSYSVYTDFEHLEDKYFRGEIDVNYGFLDKEIMAALVIENISTGEKHFQIVAKDKWNPNGIGGSNPFGGYGDFFIRDYEYTISVPDGDYIIYPALKLEGLDWERVKYNEYRQSYVEMTVKDGVESFRNPGVDLPIDSGKIEVNGIYYILNQDNNTATVTYKNEHYKSYQGDIIIPGYIVYNDTEYTVTKIGEHAFDGCRIGVLKLPYTIEEICYGAIVCDIVSINLADVTNLKRIEGWGIASSIFEELVLPPNLQYIGTNALVYPEITHLEIPRSVCHIEPMAFDCRDLSTIKVNWEERSEIPEIYHAFQSDKIDAIYIPIGTRTYYERVSEWNTYNLIEGEAGVDNIAEDDHAYVQIYDTMGRLVFEGKWSDAELDEGIYIIVDDKSTHKRFIK